jgi:hypothetical protein
MRVPPRLPSNELLRQLPDAPMRAPIDRGGAIAVRRAYGVSRFRASRNTFASIRGVNLPVFVF